MDPIAHACAEKFWNPETTIARIGRTRMLCRSQRPRPRHQHTMYASHRRIRVNSEFAEALQGVHAHRHIMTCGRRRLSGCPRLLYQYLPNIQIIYTACSPPCRFSTDVNAAIWVDRGRITDVQLAQTSQWVKSSYTVRP
jgi:hypothetical protein